MSILEMLLVWQNWLSSSKLIVSVLVDVPLKMDTSYSFCFLSTRGFLLELSEAVKTLR